MTTISDVRLEILESATAGTEPSARLQDQDGESDDPGVEILDQVSLKFFTANPSSIDPFGASTLRWQVDGPPGCRVKMDGLQVAKSGTRSVQPRQTHTFRLNATAGQASKFLGSATVNVNLAQCISRDSSLIDELVAGVLKQEIDKRDDIYFRGGSKPQVTIAPDRIRFVLRLASVLNNFPDPSVDIDVSFGLGVAADDLVFFRRKLVPIAVSISVDVSVPWWAWLIPGAQIGLAIALDMARDSARKEMQAIVNRLVDEVISPFFRSLQVPDVMEEHSARIFVVEGFGTVEVTYCPGPGLAADQGPILTSSAA
jgi:hypothetical protein